MSFSQSDVVLIPQLDPAENARLVVDDGDPLEDLAEIPLIDPARISTADEEVIEHGERIEIGNGLLDPLVPALVADLLAGRLAQLLVEGLVLSEAHMCELFVRQEPAVHEACRAEAATTDDQELRSGWMSDRT